LRPPPRLWHDTGIRHSAPPGLYVGQIGINTNKAIAAAIGQALRDPWRGAAGMSADRDPPPDPQQSAPERVAPHKPEYDF